MIHWLKKNPDNNNKNKKNQIYLNNYKNNN